MKVNPVKRNCAERIEIREIKHFALKIVDEFAEFESNSKVDSLFVSARSVKIPVSKMKANTTTNKKQHRQKQTVHILSDKTVPACRCMTVLAYTKLPPADYIVSKNRMTMGY